MQSFIPEEFNKVLAAALSPSSPNGTEARMALIGKLQAFLDETGKVMAEENNIHVDSADATNRFDSVMREMRRIVDSINPEGVDFYSSRVSFFNDPLKNYFKKVEKLDKDFSLVVDEVDRLIKSFKLDLTTMNITLSALQSKATKLDACNDTLGKATDLIRESAGKIDRNDSETMSFIEERILAWIESEKTNLSKSVIVTGQRILTVTMGIENISKIIETLKATKAVTVELFGNIVSLANERYRQRIVSNYISGTASVDPETIKDEYQKIDKILPMR